MLKFFIVKECSGIGTNVVIFGTDMDPFVHVDHKKKDIFILGKNVMQGLDDTTLTVENEYAINFT